MQQWQPGAKLKTRPYQIESILGEGGFGITYKAQHLKLDIPVVIKTPNSRLQQDINYAKYVRDFEREGKQLAKLGLNPHPHIVQVRDSFNEATLPCLVMDFIPGKSLYDLVQSQGKLSESQAIAYIRQVGSALMVCHQAGIIHRDVHPHNIIIRADNAKAVLIDFGIAGNAHTSRNTHSGNRAFAPWEQVAYWEEQNSKTPQVDIYTLAASLYYLVTGEVPYECLARKYNNRQLEIPQQLNPSLSKQTNDAILKGMEIMPQNRPPSMAAWLKLLPSKTTNSSQPNIPTPQNTATKLISQSISSEPTKTYYPDTDTPTQLNPTQTYNSKTAKSTASGGEPPVVYAHPPTQSNQNVSLYSAVDSQPKSFFNFKILGLIAGLLSLPLAILLILFAVKDLQTSKLAFAFNRLGDRAFESVAFPSAEYFAQIAQEKYERGNFAEAIARATRAIEINPNYAPAYNIRGNARYSVKKYYKAIEDYAKAIGLDPNYAPAYNGRAHVRYSLEEYYSAIDDYTRAIELNPNYVEAYNGRGHARFKLKAYQQAIADYTRAIELNPEYIYAYNGRGNARFSLKEYYKAIADYTQAIELNPQYTQAYKGRGHAREKIGDLQGSKTDLQKAR